MGTAWAEDMEELLEALLRFQEMHHGGKDISVWICTLGNYQVADGHGPSVQEQLAVDPFRKVIESEGVHCMVAVHTSPRDADLYTRLWW